MNTGFFKTSFLALALWLFSFSANADDIANFSGHWVASSGKVTSTIGLTDTCSRVEIVIEQTADQLITKSYKSDCNRYGSKWGPVTEILKNGKVYEDENEVGTIDSTTMTTKSADGATAYLYNLQLTKEASGTIALKSVYGAQSSVGTITTEATLTRQ